MTKDIDKPQGIFSGRVSRRQFLTTAALGGAGLGVAALGLKGKETFDSWQQYWALSPTDRFRYLGLGEYGDLVEQREEVGMRYQIWPIDGSLEAFISENTGEPERVEPLRQIGSKEKEAFQVSLERIDRTVLVYDEPTNLRRPYENREALKKLADITPAGIIEMLQSSDPIRITERPDHQHYAGYPLTYVDPASYKREFMSSVLWRMDHMSLMPLNYVNKDGLIKYWGTAIDTIKNTIDEYVALPWEKAQTYWFDNPLCAPRAEEVYYYNKDPQYHEKALGGLETKLIEFGYQTDGIPDDKKANWDYRFTRLMHFYLGLHRKWQAIEPDQLKREQPKAWELKYDYTLNGLKAALGRQIQWRSFWLPENADGQIAQNRQEVTRQDHPWTQRHLDIWQARLDAFFIPAQKTDDPVTNLYATLVRGGLIGEKEKQSSRFPLDLPYTA